jgi:hypothetical protein
MTFPAPEAMAVGARFQARVGYMSSMPAPDPVQSLRVSAALVERYRALVSTGMQDTSELELAIGEANQLYPEIWRHLDDARAALAAEARDLTAYDAYRRDENVHLGVADVESKLTLDAGALLVGTVRVVHAKTATFNAAGLQSAVAAMRALMGAMPEVDWGALAREEARAVAAFGSVRTIPWKRYAIVGGAVAVIGVVIALVARSLPGAEDARASAAPKVEEAEPEAGPTLTPEQVVAEQENKARLARIAALRPEYEATCDPAVQRELVDLMTKSSLVGETEKVRDGVCVPARPECSGVRDSVAKRVAGAFALAVDGSLAAKCNGIVIAEGARYVPAIAFVVTGVARGRARAYRGVTRRDGGADVVPFALTTAPTLVGVANLDGEVADEIVTAGEHELLVSSVAGGAFVDARGPTLGRRCAANVNVERDFRDGRKGERQVLVRYDAPDGVEVRGCPSPGRRYFTLVDGAVVESI